MRVLVVTNMYPTATEPWFGCFVAEQVADVRAFADVDVLVIDGRSRASNYARAVRDLRHRVRSANVDVVHAHYGLSGAVAMLQHAAPVVTTFHGSDTKRIWWQARVSWVVARQTTPVFVARSGAVALGLPGAAVLPAAVDLERFRPVDRREARRRLGWDESGRYVLLPGSRTNPVKRADLFDAVDEKVGRGVTTAALEGLSRDEVALVMNAADVTLMTSDAEGSPVAVKESLASLTPVVSVRVGDVPDLLADVPGCAVADRTVDALADAVGRALDAPRDEAMRRRVEPYSRPEIARRLKKIYAAAV
jgi:glycosyltransferase involved in cell wall biosynthesis